MAAMNDELNNLVNDLAGIDLAGIPPPPPLMRHNASFGPEIQVELPHNFPPDISGGLSIEYRNDGGHLYLGHLNGHVATFACRNTYTDHVGSRVWIEQYVNGQWRKTVIFNELPALAPAPVHDQMQEPMAG